MLGEQVVRTEPAQLYKLQSTDTTEWNEIIVNSKNLETGGSGLFNGTIWDPRGDTVENRQSG
jgi:hypothetical protein